MCGPLSSCAWSYGASIFSCRTIVHNVDARDCSSYAGTDRSVGRRCSACCSHRSRDDNRSSVTLHCHHCRSSTSRSSANRQEARPIRTNAAVKSVRKRRSKATLLEPSGECRLLTLSQLLPSLSRIQQRSPRGRFQQDHPLVAHTCLAQSRPDDDAVPADPDDRAGQRHECAHGHEQLHRGAAVPRCAQPESDLPADQIVVNRARSGLRRAPPRPHLRACTSLSRFSMSIHSLSLFECTLRIRMNHS